ncbi:MAG: transporter [Hyphomicrobiales bacterium]|jgi:branched-chain amino acid transport system substrate-binding protein|nr:transporter [Hyphomicrobiales bacterium]
MRSISAGAIVLALAVQTGTPAFAADPLKIGVLMETTGVFAPLGKRQLDGMRFAVEEAGGEVAGRKIELVHEDTEGKPDVGLNKARKLVLSDKVDVMAGIINSAVALAVAPYLSTQRVPLVLSNASTDTLTGDKCDRYLFRVSYSSAQITEPIGQWMAKNAPKNIFILASDYVAPHEYVAAFKKGYLAGGGTIAGEAYPPFNRTQDYGPYISQARAANPGAIFSVFFAGEALLFVKQYDSFGMKTNIPLYGPIGLTPPVLRKAQGPAAAGIISASNYVAELDHPENRSFREAYKKKFGEDPEEFAVMGYDSIRFIIDAVKARNGDTKDRPALVSAIEKVSYVGPRGPMKMAANHQATQNVYIVKTVPKGDDVAFEVIDTFKDFVDPVQGCNMK